MSSSAQKKNNVISDTSFYVALCLIFCLSFFLRIYKIDLCSYWIDEMVSMNFAKHPLWQSVFWDNNPLFYHSLLKIWVRLFGDAESATRMLSVLFSVSATLLMMKLGFFMRGKLGALLFGLLHSISVLSILYAQETRMYAMFECFMAFQLYAFFRLYHEGKGLRLFTIGAVLMSFSHYLAIIPLSIEGLFLLLNKRFDLKQKKQILGALSLPLVVEVSSYLYFFKWDGLKWQNLKFSVEPYSILPIDLINDFSNRSWVFGLIFLGTLAASVFYLKKEKEVRQFDFAFFITMIGLPIVVMFFSALVFRRSVFLSRYFIYMIPVLLCWFGTALIDLKVSTVLKSAALAVMFASTCYALMTRVYIPYKEPWRDVAGLVAKFPASLILTTRTVAIRVPYFEKMGVEVMKWNPFDDKSFDFLKGEVTRRKRVWVIENYWGGYPYMSKLSEKLKAAKMGVSELSVRTDYSIPILVMLVEELSTGTVLK